jgi:hypothetical protein
LFDEYTIYLKIEENERVAQQRTGTGKVPRIPDPVCLYFELRLNDEASMGVAPTADSVLELE